MKASPLCFIMPLCFCGSKQSTIYMKHIKTYLTAVALALALFASAQSSQDIIKINQSGYYPQAPKIAVLTSNYNSDEYAGTHLHFYVLQAERRDTVYKNNLGAIRQSANSSIKTRLIDFSALQRPGTYVIYVPGIGDSYPFEIKD